MKYPSEASRPPAIPRSFQKALEETMSFEMMFDDGFRQSAGPVTAIPPTNAQPWDPRERSRSFPESVAACLANQVANRARSSIPQQQEIVLPQTLQQAALHEAFASAILAGESSFRRQAKWGCAIFASQRKPFTNPTAEESAFRFKWPSFQIEKFSKKITPA